MLNANIPQLIGTTITLLVVVTQLIFTIVTFLIVRQVRLMHRSFTTPYGRFFLLLARLLLIASAVSLAYSIIML